MRSPPRDQLFSAEQIVAIEYTQALDLSGEQIEIKHAAIDAEQYIVFLGHAGA